MAVKSEALKIIVGSDSDELKISRLNVREIEVELNTLFIQVKFSLENDAVRELVEYLIPLLGLTVTLPITILEGRK